MGAKKRKFKTEVQQLLDLVVHSLYSNKEIFLRELISNASDAIDRARFEALSDESLLEDDSDWKIKIAFDKEKRTLTVSDNGIGMGMDDIDACIGTIANSGTRKFLEQLQENKENMPPELIGQFGVGFYAAFMIADKVTVLTRHAGAKDAAVSWTSDGTGSYTVEEAVKETRGTEVVLHISEEHEEFVEEWKIRKIVTKFSDFVEHPITMDITREETPRDEEGKPIEGAEAISKTTEETLNSQKAIWQRPKSEITDEEYNEFYKHVSHDFQDPLETLHWNVEGRTEFRSLLYIPSKTQFDMFTPDTRNKGVQLYVRRVFITDNCEELVPQYMRFLRGVVDSSDLPLNVSRELLQEDRIIRTMRKNIVKKVIDTFTGMMEKNRDKYVQFWTEFGAIFKEGMHTDFENREKLQDLLLFQSTNTDDGVYTSLAEYVERMPESQKEIYFLTGEDRGLLEQSPHLEAFKGKDYEVLFMTDPIDEWAVGQSLQAYKDKPVKSIAKGDVNLDTEDEKKEKEEGRKESEESNKDLVEKIKSILEDRVKDVRLSQRLTDSACCLVADEHDMGIHMEKIMKAMNQDLPGSKRILELNPEHPIVEVMRGLFDKSPDHAKLSEYAELLYDQALLTASLPVKDPLAFAQRVSELMAAEGRTLLADA
ncbi:MAG: molecular chaperone HtpG [Lentisphaeria bacterium]|nr:molecular chaperone HtpG [Lentisphaeria bacterium]